MHPAGPWGSCVRSWASSVRSGTQMLQAPLIGFLFGFVGSVPVAGPIAALVLARGLAGKFRSGFFIALGGALPEGLYAFLAFWGFDALLGTYPWVDPVCKAVAAVILFGLGLWMMRSQGASVKAAVAADNAERTPRRKSWFRSFTVGFNITLFNPTLLATWAAAVGILRGTGFRAFGPTNGLLFASFAAVGIVAWFSAMLWIIHHVHARFDDGVLVNIRRGFGIMLLAVSFWFVWQTATYLA